LPFLPPGLCQPDFAAILFDQSKSYVDVEDSKGSYVFVGRPGERPKPPQRAVERICA
jgi:hypothetical protein